MDMQQLAKLMREVIREELQPITEGMEKLEQRMDKFEQTQKDNMSEIRSHFKHIDDKSDTVQHVIAKLSTRFMYTEAEVEKIKEMLQ